jgi:hypothetical protein
MTLEIKVLAVDRQSNFVGIHRSVVLFWFSGFFHH